MILNNLKHAILFSCLIAGILCLPLPTLQSASLTEAFDTPVDGIPAGWTLRLSGSVDNTNGNTVGIKEINPETGNALRFYRGGGSGAIYYTSPLGESSDGKMSDFSAEIIIRPSGNTNAFAVNSSAGFVVRAQSLTYNNFNGYYIAISMGTGEGNGRIGIYENPTGHNHSSASGTLHAYDTFSTSLLNNTDYKLEMSAVGSVITASLWTLGATPIELASATYLSANTTAGYFGLRNGFGNTNQAVYMRDLYLEQAIPEPSAVLLLFTGLIGFLSMRRYSHSQAL